MRIFAPKICWIILATGFSEFTIKNASTKTDKANNFRQYCYIIWSSFFYKIWTKVSNSISVWTSETSWNSGRKADRLWCKVGKSIYFLRRWTGIVFVLVSAALNNQNIKLLIHVLLKKINLYIILLFWIKKKNKKKTMPLTFLLRINA